MDTNILNESNRRASSRFSISGVGLLKIKNNLDRPINFIPVNISSHGFCFVSDEPKEISDIIFLKIPNFLLPLALRVIWAKKMEPLSFSQDSKTVVQIGCILKGSTIDLVNTLWHTRGIQIEE